MLDAGCTIVISHFLEERILVVLLFGTYLVKAVQREEKDRELLLLLATARRGEAKAPRRAFQFGWDDPHRTFSPLGLISTFPVGSFGTIETPFERQGGNGE